MSFRHRWKWASTISAWIAIDALLVLGHKNTASALAVRTAEGPLFSHSPLFVGHVQCSLCGAFRRATIHVFSPCNHFWWAWSANQYVIEFKFYDGTSSGSASFSKIILFHSSSNLAWGVSVCNLFGNIEYPFSNLSDERTRSFRFKFFFLLVCHENDGWEWSGKFGDACFQTKCSKMEYPSGYSNIFDFSTSSLSNVTETVSVVVVELPSNIKFKLSKRRTKSHL